ncbi:MAG: hypothetical protein ABSB82_02760 [Terriglobia bacterium]|jgi:hypothetical protein
MNEVMTWAEIESRFKSEWVLLEDPEATEALEVKGGKVLWHGKDRHEVYRKAMELRPKHSAILYIGPAIQEGHEAVFLTPRFGLNRNDACPLN